MNKKRLIITPDISFKGYFGEMFAARKVLFFLVGREVLSCYKQTTFGILWALLQPLSMMLILTMIYRHYIPTGNEAIPYSVFVLAGLLAWQFFVRTLESAAGSMLQHKTLITKIYIPRIFIPLSNSLVGFIDAVFGMLLLLAVIFYYRLPLHWELLLMPFFLFYSFFAALGIGLIFSVLNAQYRDVQYAIPFLIRLSFFITPISYPISVIPTFLWPAYFLNPLTGAVELLRWSISGGALYVPGVLISFFVSLTCFVYSLRVFQKMEFRIVDIL